MTISKRHARQIREGILLAREYQHQLRGYIANPMTTPEQFQRLSTSYVKLAKYGLTSLGIKAYIHTIDKGIKERIGLVLKNYLDQER